MFKKICSPTVRRYWKKAKYVLLLYLLYIFITLILFLFRLDFGKYDVVMPGVVSEPKSIPDHIKKPKYHQNGTPFSGPAQPEVKNSVQIEKMRHSCKLAASVLYQIGQQIKVL